MKRPPRILSLFLCFLLLLPLFTGLTSCSSGPVTENRVTSVALKKGKLRVEAGLTEGFLNSYTEKKVYLFELPSHYSSGMDLSELDPVAEAKPRASLSFELEPMDGMRTRLFSSYLVASYDPATRAYTPLTAPVSVSNPEATAVYTPPALSGEKSIKGLISDYPADAIRLGVTHTVVDVCMEKLILSDWQEDAVAYVFGGVTRYLNAEALEELDETVDVYTAAGMEVYLRFVLGNAVGENAPLGLYAPTDAVVDHAADHAVDMSNPFAADIMEGFLDFMAERYASPADGSLPVSAFIMGYRVNDARQHNYMGETSLSAYVTNYEKLVRVAHIALKSHNPAGRVYLSLDSRRTLGAEDGGWDVAAFLAAFRDECALRGDYGWHVACELYADTSALWEENPAADTAHYTVRNLNTLTDLLDGEKYRAPDGQPRRLLISGLEIPAVTVGGTPSETEANRQAASYAYAYMTCVQNGRVEALIYSRHADPAPDAGESALCGLWTVEKKGTEPALPAATRPIYNVFKVIDTTESATLSSGLTAIMGASYTKLESAMAGKTLPVTFVKGTGKLQSFEETHKKATALYTFDGGSLRGFESAGNLTYLELADAETLNRVTLHARFDRAALCDPMGITVTLPATDLIGGKELLFDLYAGPVRDGNASAAKPTVTLRLTRAATGSVADGDGEVLYEASVSDIKGSVWQTAVFSVEDFTARLDASDEVTLTLLLDYPLDMEGNGAPAHNLGLAGVYVTGKTAASGTPAGVVIAVTVGLIALVGAVFVILLLRHRKRKAGNRRP